MSAFKDEVIEGIVDREGQYSDDPADSGGKTAWGITERVARRFGYRGPMRDMPREYAMQVYAKKYWDDVGLQETEKISPLITAEVADTAVNLGPYRAAEILQRSLNALNDCERIYSDLTVDGDIGPKTCDALTAYLDARPNMGACVLLRALDCLQGAHYIDLSERRQKDQRFVFGWLLHRIANVPPGHFEVT